MGSSCPPEILAHASFLSYWEEFMGAYMQDMLDIFGLTETDREEFSTIERLNLDRI
jgi:hypothetical protein